MTGFKPASDVVYKGCIHLCADRRKITFRFGENRHFHVGVDTDKLICGGTGYGSGQNLPDAVEHTLPDYGLYPQFLDTAYGFLTRGCPNRCGFCIVSGKEGDKSVHTADLSEF